MVFDPSTNNMEVASVFEAPVNIRIPDVPVYEVNNDFDPCNNANISTKDNIDDAALNYSASSAVDVSAVLASSDMNCGAKYSVQPTMSFGHPNVPSNHPNVVRGLNSCCDIPDLHPVWNPLKLGPPCLPLNHEMRVSIF